MSNIVSLGEYRRQKQSLNLTTSNHPRISPDYLLTLLTKKVAELTLEVQGLRAATSEIPLLEVRINSQRDIIKQLVKRLPTPE